MPVEEVAVGGIFRILSWLVMEFFLQMFCWGIGWVTLKIFTLGTYPKPSTKHTHVIAVGLVELIAILVAITVYAS
jgi:hypothetical protein